MLQGLQHTTNVVDGWRPSSVRWCGSRSLRPRAGQATDWRGDQEPRRPVAERATQQAHHRARQLDARRDDASIWEG